MNEDNNYCAALIAAGATVHSFETFGDYQGSWWAKVTYKSETGFTNGCFGSCSGCDAFMNEFDDIKEKCDIWWRSILHPTDCAECKELKTNYDNLVGTFGKQYLEDVLLTYDKAIEISSKNLDWDDEQQKIVDKVVNW